MFDMRNTLAPAPSQEKNQIRSVLISSCLMKAGGSSGGCPKGRDEQNNYIPGRIDTNADGRKVLFSWRLWDTGRCTHEDAATHGPSLWRLLNREIRQVQTQMGEGDILMKMLGHWRGYSPDDAGTLEGVILMKMLRHWKLLLWRSAHTWTLQHGRF